MLPNRGTISPKSSSESEARTSSPAEIYALDQRHLDALITRLRTGPSTHEDQPETRQPKDASLGYYLEHTSDDRPYPLIKTVAVLRLRGYLAKRGWWCDTSFDRFSDMVRFAAEDYAVDTILIDADTPGGSVYGCPDCCDVVYEARNKKRIITVVNDLCASAGLWVGSAANEIVITQSGDIGSLGVYQMRIDMTDYLKREGISVEIIRAGQQKAWGSPYLPMTDAERKVMQAEVDGIYDSFINAVARNRNTDPGRVRRDWADAKIFNGQEAVNIGLADRVASFDEVLAELIGRPIINGVNKDGQSSPDRDQLKHPRRWAGRVRRGS